mmetsp:Transcript_5129/g.5715  ORF Transcript_5129/g.5715 Transcript_5129/m.5715 type:complete len:321 (+) Transcript_5129:80-1042(+)
MMMLMKALVLVVAGVSPSVLRVVQGQTTNPCGDFNKKKCEKKDKCTWNSFGELCLLTAGTDSVVREGSQNAAPGKYSVVGGGQWNEAGDTDDAYSVIGGGLFNACYGGSKNTISGGNTNGIVPIDDADADVPDFNTISGGWTNTIAGGPYSVITGGGGEFDSDEENSIEGCDTSTVSGGKKNRIGPLPPDVGGDGNTISGGFDNIIEKSDMQYRTITGGLENDVKGQGAVVSGGEQNRAVNTNSLAFGQNAAAIFDHSMVVNLIGGLDKDDTLISDEDGQFLVSAESFLFQIGDGNDGIDSTELTKTNIQNLRTALEEEE